MTQFGTEKFGLDLVSMGMGWHIFFLFKHLLNV